MLFAHEIAKYCPYLTADKQETANKQVSIFNVGRNYYFFCFLFLFGKFCAAILR